MSINWWTLGLQAINVAILVWLLGHFFWQPVAAMIAQRRETAQRILAEADSKRGQADAALAEIARMRAGFAQERQAVLDAARVAAEQESQSRLKQAEKDVAALQAASQAAIEKQRMAAEQAWADTSSHLAADIAGRLLARQDSAAVRARFLDLLIDQVEHLPAAVRQTLVSAQGSAEIVSATALDAAEQDLCRSRLAKALGTDLQLAFRTDPGLIAGLDLRGSTLSISNSWRADLDRILADLKHD